MSEFWSWFVIVLTVGNILAMLWLLLATSKKKGDSAEQETTGHTWDGIQELNNPLPRWWFGLFIITIIFSGVYLFLFPGLGNYEGSLDWSQRDQYQTARASNAETQAAYFSEFADLSIVDLAQNQQAMETGQRLFLNNCATCHGSAAQGAKGFPNLTDSDWLYGSSPETILATIENGRAGMMPNLNLSARNVSMLALYLRHRAGLEEANEFVITEAEKTLPICAGCHGPDLTGNQVLGAPNLTDDVWLHGSSIGDIESVLANGKQGNMPAFGQLLNDQEIKLLAAYVTSLSAPD
jgi:cytochrome c oxidase cbb3-type subunit 3